MSVLRGRLRLEVDATGNLDAAWIAAVVLVERAKIGVVGNQIVAAGGAAVGSDVIQVTAGILSVVEEVVELAPQREANAFANIEVLVQGRVNIVSWLQRP